MTRGLEIMAAWTASSHWRTRPAYEGDAMRTLRLCLVGMVILWLAGGLSVAVAAQDEEPAPVTYVTGTVVEQWTHDDPSAPDEPDTGPAPDVHGYTIAAPQPGRRDGPRHRSVDR